MIRHTLDVRDKFYAAEQDYYDETLPSLSALSTEFNRAIVSSPKFGELKTLINPLIVRGMEASLQSYGRAHRRRQHRGEQARDRVRQAPRRTKISVARKNGHAVRNARILQRPRPQSAQRGVCGYRQNARRGTG